MDFQELGVAPQIVEMLSSRGLKVPTPIQVEVFPLVVAGKAVRILSKTGTGKTLAYVLPLVQRYLLEESPESPLKMLVVVPTRELAFQVASTFETLGFKEKTSVVVGGENETAQIKTWKNAAVAIATPGRLLDLLDRRAVDPTHLKAIIFDEADRLIDMGFIDDIRRIYARLPKGLQVLFASATMNLAVDEIGYEFGLELERAGVETDEMTAENLIHKISYVGDQEKFHAIANYVADHQESRGIIFSNYRERAHDIAKRLKGLGWAGEALSAQLNQDQRNSIIESYRNGKTKVLVASDLASRGLDFLDIDYVINHDLPEDPAVYVHRVGRTARAGRKGEAISLIGFNDSFQLDKLQQFLGAKIERYDFNTEQLSGSLPRRPRPAGEPRPQSDRPQTSQAPASRPQSSQSQPSRPQGASSDRDRRPHSSQDSRSPRESRPPQSTQSSAHRPHSPSRSQPHQRPAQTHSSVAQTTAKPAVKSGLLKRIMSFFGMGKTTAPAKAQARPHEAARSHSGGRSHSQGRRPEGRTEGRPEGARPEGRSQHRRRGPRRPHRGPKRTPEG